MRKVISLISCFLILFFVAAYLAAPTFAAYPTLESLPIATFVNFGGRTWQKARFFNGTAEDTSAQTYLIMSSDFARNWFDWRENFCFTNTGGFIGYNSLADSGVMLPYLNNDIFNSLSNNDWIIPHSWTITDDSNNNFRAISVAASNNTATCANRSANANFFTVAPASFTTKIGLPSVAEMVGNPSGLAATCGGVACWLRTPNSTTDFGQVVRAVSNSGGATIGVAGTDQWFVRPSLHLKPGLLALSGDGTAGNPYVLGDLCGLPENANKLFCLPFGSVIQMQGMDTTVCENLDCSQTSNTIPPYKFVKMQARDQNGTPIDNNNNTYWTLLDNYCWWGSANCLDADGVRSASGSAWNADSNTVYNNNISAPQTHNFLTVISNFYNSLPNIIADHPKSEMVLDHNWEMFSIFNTAGTGTTTAGACATGWTTGNHTTGGNTFNFSAPATCTMTSKIGLPSYTEWQGGLLATGNWTNTGLNTQFGGAGGSFCYSRFGIDCTNGGSYDLFKYYTSQFSSYAPWFRSPLSDINWRVGNQTNISVDSGGSFRGFSITPSLWLSSSLSTTGAGAGTYADPYQIDTSPGLYLTLANANLSQTLSSVDSFSLIGSVTDVSEGQTVNISATINGITKTAQLTSPLSEQTYTLTWTAAEIGDGFTNGTTPIPVIADNGLGQALVNYTGTLTVDFSARLAFSVTNADQDLMVQAGEGFTFSGLYNATNSAIFAQDVTFTATIAGIAHTFTQSQLPTSMTQNRGWSLSWTNDELAPGIYFGPSAPLAFIGELGGNHQVAKYYSGYLTVGAEQITPESLDLLAQIASLLSVRFAGTLHLPVGTTPGSASYPDTSQYTFNSHLDANHDLWDKTLSDGNTYPFLVEYFGSPSDQGSVIGVTPPAP